MSRLDHYRLYDVDRRRVISLWELGLLLLHLHHRNLGLRSSRKERLGLGVLICVHRLLGRHHLRSLTWELRLLVTNELRLGLTWKHGLLGRHHRRSLAWELRLLSHDSKPMRLSLHSMTYCIVFLNGFRHIRNA